MLVRVSLIRYSVKARKWIKSKPHKQMDAVKFLEAGKPRAPRKKLKSYK